MTPAFIVTDSLEESRRVCQVLNARPKTILDSCKSIDSLLPDRSDDKELRYVLYTAMDALRGILVAGFVDDDPGRARRRWNRACSKLNEDLREALAQEGMASA